MLPILQIGPLAIQLPGLLLLLGVWLGTLLAERGAKEQELNAGKVSNLIFYALIAGVIGARFGYVLRFLSIYLQSPLDMIALNPNTLSIPEGVAAALLLALVYGQRAGLPAWRTLDALTPGFAVFMILVGLAHLSSGDAFGVESDLPWAVELWGARRHPTQIYEVLGASLILVAVQGLGKKPGFEGFLFLIFSGLTAVAHFGIEAVRGDSLIVAGNLRNGQIIDLIVLGAVLVALHLQARKAHTPR